jgi:hypothetical protein
VCSTATGLPEVQREKNEVVGVRYVEQDDGQPRSSTLLGILASPGRRHHPAPSQLGATGPDTSTL